MYQVLKRDGKVVDFDLSKISQAITMAFEAQEKNFVPSVIDFLALKVTANFEPKIKEGVIAVEDIQDSVESVLVQAGYDDVAKAYRHIYQCGTSTFNALKRIENDIQPSEERDKIVNFVRNHKLKIVAVPSHEDIED